jgi:hydroxymethylglutaryl-CoA lyase
VQAYLAVAFECPFEGAVDPVYVQELAALLLEAGASELVIADTIGAANPAQVKRADDRDCGSHGPERLACHFHDTRALGLANVYAAIESGVRRFDASVGGLGGCPLPRARRAMSPPRTWSCSASRWASAPGSTCPRCWSVVDLISDMLGHAQGGRAHYWLSRNAA